MTTANTTAKSRVKSLSAFDKLKMAMESDTTDAIPNSFFSRAKHIIGSIDTGVSDLSSNKEHLKGFGRSKNENNS
jgi:hypothetical protein